MIEIKMKEEILVADWRSDEGFRIRKSGCSPTILSESYKGLANCPVVIYKGYVGGSDHHANAVVDAEGISPTVLENHGKVQKVMEDKERTNVRIRKLTPRECWRLMGFTDEEFDRAKAVNSDSQLYKQAGNSIVVNVLEAIFGQMI